MVSKKEKRDAKKVETVGGEDPYKALAPEERKKLAEAAKSKGNEAFAASKLADAKKFFTEAIALDPSEAVYYSNRSAVHLGLKKIANAIEDAKKATELKPEWWKGYSRLGNAYAAKGSNKEAARAFARGLSIEGEEANEALTSGLEEAKAGCNEEDLADVMRDLAIREAQAKARKEAKEASDIQHIIGIDLGTTYSCVGVWKDGGVEIVANSEGQRTTPSIVSFADSERLVGEPARAQGISNPNNTIYDAKRLIGSSFSDEKVQKDIKHFPFKVLEGEGSKPMIEVTFEGATRQFSPEEISAIVLERMKKTAEDYLGVAVSKAVVTVPAYFNDSQRVATRNAGTIAGLDVKRIINEPTAAAVAYGLDASNKTSGKDAKILVFDLGGGTFDVSVLRIDGGIFEVLATGGDTHLGGEDFDNNTVQFLAEEYIRKNKDSKLLDNARAMKRLRQAAERAKRILSSATSTQVEVDDLIDGNDFSATLSRAKFEQLQKEPFGRCLEAVKLVLDDAKITHRDIDEVVLVGGSTRIPRIQADLKEFFGGKELNKSINPDEAVAYGAAVQGAILSGIKDSKHNNVLLVDVTPLSLGIEMSGRIMSVLIKRNTAIPVRKTKTYTTEEDYQERVDIPIFEGERACTDGNNKLGDFTISGIERAKRGIAQIEVTFDLDANGILSVYARDLKTGASADITISNDRGRLSPEEIERMVNDAEKFRAQDEAHAAQIEARSDLERFVYSTLEQAKSISNIDLSVKIEETRQWLEDHPEATAAEYNEKKGTLERALRRPVTKGRK